MKLFIKPLFIMIGVLGFAIWTLWLTEAMAYTEYQSEQGREVYKSSCISCHGDAGIGGAGPPLNNILQKYPTQQDVFNYASKFMPVGRAGELPQEEYEAVAAYIMSLNGVEAEQEQAEEEPPLEPKEPTEPDDTKAEEPKEEEPKAEEPKATDKDSDGSLEKPSEDSSTTAEPSNTGNTTEEDSSEEKTEDTSEQTTQETMPDTTSNMDSETTDHSPKDTTEEASGLNILWIVILLGIIVVGSGIWLIQKRSKKKK
jgi:cytochrome c2